MMNRFKKIARYSIIVAAILMIGLLIFAHAYFGALVSAPPTNRTDLSPTPVAVILIQPRKAAPFIHALVNRQSPVKIPRWALDRSLPYEATILLSENTKGDYIDIHALLTMPRFAPLATRYMNDNNLRENMPEVNWNPHEVQRPQSGTILLEGSVPMEEDTLDDVWMQWNQSIQPAPLAMAEGHFIEGLFDNRIGAGYLAMASLLYAFDIDLDDQEQKISLTSFQFVLSMRLAIDITNDNAVEIYFIIEVLPEAKQRLAVINLKVALDDAFENMKTDLAREHEIVMTGEMKQTENIIEYTYRIEDAMSYVELWLAGDM